MKKLISLFLLLASSSAFAEAPNDHKIFSAILKDSGFEASNLALKSPIMVDENVIEDDPRASRYSLQFQHQDQAYFCKQAATLSREVNPGEYLVMASVKYCFDAHANQVELKNNYASEWRPSTFVRVFYNSNTKFRFPTRDEMHRWKKKLMYGNLGDINRIDLEALQTIQDSHVVIKEADSTANAE